MMDTTLNQVQNLVNQLTPIDQVRLLEYLTSRIADFVKANQYTESHASIHDTWREFFRIGEEVESSDSPDMATLTSAVTSMRR